MIGVGYWEHVQSVRRSGESAAIYNRGGRNQHLIKHEASGAGSGDEPASENQAPGANGDLAAAAALLEEGTPLFLMDGMISRCRFRSPRRPNCHYGCIRLMSAGSGGGACLEVGCEAGDAYLRCRPEAPRRPVTAPSMTAGSADGVP